jgi:hypothetical protein
VAAVPSWYPDPTGRHDYRWWDGRCWTEHVSTAGVAAIDWTGAGNQPTEVEAHQRVEMEAESRGMPTFAEVVKKAAAARAAPTAAQVYEAKLARAAEQAAKRGEQVLPEFLKAIAELLKSCPRGVNSRSPFSFRHGHVNEVFITNEASESRWKRRQAAIPAPGKFDGWVLAVEGPRSGSGLWSPARFPVLSFHYLPTEEHWYPQREPCAIRVSPSGLPRLHYGDHGQRASLSLQEAVQRGIIRWAEEDRGSDSRGGERFDDVGEMLLDGMRMIADYLAEG